MAFHPFGVALATGSTDGHLVIFNTETGSSVVTVRVCGSPLNCVAYNPCKFIDYDNVSQTVYFCGKLTHNHEGPWNGFECLIL